LRRLNPECLRACLEGMRHRGPDADGTYQHAFRTGRQVSLLHSRLAIIDLDRRADQPYRTGSMALVFNGELYNYVELRRELARAGQEFTTQSDTEVLLRVLLQYGWEGLDRCEGMWAFALYDEADGSLMLCRDRFGEKPLYLYRDAGDLYLGSEPKLIAALRGRALEPNVNHVIRYLVNGYKSLYKTEETFFVGLEELEPGSILKVDAEGRGRQWRYWQPSFEPDEGMSREHAVEGVRAALIESIRLRLRADVPLAFCMSGGVDSNALISIAKRRFGFDVHGFTIVNEDERYDEREEVEAAVRELGVRHTSVPVGGRQARLGSPSAVPSATGSRRYGGGDFLENLRLLVLQHDGPVSTISYYVHWLLMGAIAEQGYKISISGTAADELLTGYYDHHNLWLYEMRNEPDYSDALAAWKRHIAPLVRNPYLKNPSLYMEDPACRDHVYLGHDGFAACLQRPWSEAFQERRYTSSLLRNRMLNELFHETVPVLLREDDLNAMSYSIENRSPYLDRRLFEFCCRIPTRHLMRDAFTKAILREATADLVPERVLWNRRKVGFNAPILDLLDTSDTAVVDGVLSPGPIFGLVRRDRIEALMRRDFLPNSESKFLFSLLCAKMFLEECKKV